MKLFLFLACLLSSVVAIAGEIPQEMFGDWSLDIESGEPGWLRIAEADGEPEVSMLVDVGSVKPLKGVEIRGGEIHVPLKTYRDEKKGAVISTNRAEVRWEEGALEGVMTDFSATGAYGNLMTGKVFGDGKLHIEFVIEKYRNSGIYVRGMYEAQVVDRDSRMQGLQGVGSIFGLVERQANPAKPGGEWQTYEITLVDRHITVVLNGVTTIDNQPVTGPTAGAVQTNPLAPGPLYLQGDHTSVKYRDIVFWPVE